MSFDVSNLKKAFFDTKAVTDKVDPAVRKALSKVGAFVRQRDRSSLKYKKGASSPGTPPHVHRSAGFTRKRMSKGKVTSQPASPLRELIFFAYDPARRSVVIGPAIGGSQSGAPRTVEEGGTATVRDATGHSHVVRVRARPHTGPAFRAGLAEVGPNFLNCIR